MPYRRRYTRKRRRFARKFIKFQRKYKKRYRKPNLSTQVRRLKQKVNKDIEHRWSDDITYSFNIPAAGGTVEALGLELISTTAGPGLNNDRLGNKLTLKSIYIKGQLLVADPRNFVRVLLVQTISLDQIVVASDILQPDPSTTNPTLYSPYRKESRIKYKVLHDKFYKLQTQAAGSIYPSVLNIDMSAKWVKGLTITYNSPLAGVPIYSNVYIVAISDSVATAHPSFRGSKRLTWIA